MNDLGETLVRLEVANRLYRSQPDLPSDELAKRVNWAVGRKQLASTARSLELGQLLKLGVGEGSTGGRDRTGNLAVAYRAVLGAIRVGHGDHSEADYEKARQVLIRTHSWAIEKAVNNDFGSPWKNELRAWANWHGLDSRYEVVEAGPAHEPRFHATVITTEPVSEGIGGTKKAAETIAAQLAVAKFRKASPDVILPKPTDGTRKRGRAKRGR